MLLQGRVHCIIIQPPIHAMSLYESIGDLNIKNTLIVYKHQFYCPHSFRLVNEYEEVIRNNNILVLDMKEIGRLEWVYITPIYFDKVGQLMVGAGTISNLFRKMPRMPSPSTRVLTLPTGAQAPTTGGAPPSGPSPMPGMEAPAAGSSSGTDSHEGKFVNGKFVSRTVSAPKNDDVNAAVAAMMASRKIPQRS